MKLLRIDADRSVIGGCLDPEFAGPSRQFIEEVKAGRVAVHAYVNVNDHVYVDVVVDVDGQKVTLPVNGYVEL